MEPLHHKRRRRYRGKQQGVATLAIGMIILVLATIVTVTSLRVGVREQQISANEYRHKRSFEAAQAGADFAQMYMQANLSELTDTTQWTWTRCDADGDGTPETFPGWDASLNGFCEAGWLWATFNALPPAARLEQPDDVTTATRVVYLTEDLRDIDGTSNPDGIPDNLGTILIDIVAEGAADIPTGSAQDVNNGNSYSFVKVTSDPRPVVPNVPEVPLIASNTVDGSGTFDIVVAPDAAGEGAQLSTWSESNVDLASGTALTCNPHEFYDSGNPYYYNEADPTNTTDTYEFGEIDPDPDKVIVCDNCACSKDSALSVKDGSDHIEGIDILDDEGANPQFGENPNDINFPADLFLHVFGIPHAQWQLMKNQADVILGPSNPDPTLQDCSALNAASSGFYWVEVDCSLNTQIGTPTDPVLLVVAGDITLTGNDNVYGLLFVFDEDLTDATIPELRFGGNKQFYGAIVAEGTVDLGAGTYQIVYSDKVLSNIFNKKQTLARVPGTWADYLP